MAFDLSKTIGDLSRADKEVLKVLAGSHDNILEVGVGGSTQILTHYSKGQVVSYDTSLVWLGRIRELIETLEVKGAVRFRYIDKIVRFEGKYDMAFIDCLWSLRFEAAHQAWKVIAPKGIIVFHDTRRAKDQKIVSQFILENYSDISEVQLNSLNSNLTIITKSKKPKPFENWHDVENMSDEKIGIDWLKNENK